MLNLPTLLTDPSGLADCNPFNPFTWRGCAENIYNGAAEIIVKPVATVVTDNIVKPAATFAENNIVEPFGEFVSEDLGDDLLWIVENMRKSLNTFVFPNPTSPALCVTCTVVPDPVEGVKRELFPRYEAESRFRITDPDKYYRASLVCGAVAGVVVASILYPPIAGEILSYPEAAVLLVEGATYCVSGGA